MTTSPLANFQTATTLAISITSSLVHAGIEALAHIHIEEDESMRVYAQEDE